MKRWNLVSAGMILALVACSSTGGDKAATQEPMSSGNVSTTTKEGPGSLEQARTTQVTATVESIDHATRHVTLRTADNRSVTIVASDAVRNLAQVQVGDQVNVKYIESVVIQVRRAGESTPGVSAASATTRAPVGAMPAATQVDSVTLTTKIAEIDRKTQTVTLQNADGTRRTVPVRNPAQFDHIAVGDMVDITLTDAVAISVERPATR